MRKMNVLRTCIISCLTVLTAIFTVSAQTPHPEWRYLSTEIYAYPQLISISSDLARDSSGGMWIGGDGIVHYDGKIFTHYDSASVNLPARGAAFLVFDSAGVLWFGSNNGLGRFDGKTWTVYRTDNCAIPSNDISSIALAPDQTLWIGFRSGSAGLASFDGTQWRSYSKTNSDIPENNAFSLICDQRGAVWFTSWKPDGWGCHGLFCFDGATWEKMPSHPDANVFYPFLCDDDSSIWVTLEDWTVLGSKPEYGIRWETKGIGVYKDDWVATHDFPVAPWHKQVGPLVGLKDTGAGKWVGNSSGSGLRLRYYDGVDWRDHFIPEEIWRKLDRATALEFDPCGNLWIAGALRPVLYKRGGVRPLDLFLQIASATGKAGDTLRAPIMLLTALDDETISAFSIDLEFDTLAAHLIAVEAPPGSLLAGGSFSISPTASGARVSSLGSFRLTGAGLFLECVFLAMDAEEDTLRTRVTAKPASMEVPCSYQLLMYSSEITVLPRNPIIACEIDVPDSARWDTHKRSYDPESFAVTMRIVNNGDREARNVRFRISYNPEHVTLVSPTAETQLGSAPNLRPGEEMSVTWMVAALNTLSELETELCIVASFDNANDAMCCERMIIGQVKAILECTMYTPEIQANNATMKFEPDPFSVIVVVRNTGLNIARDVKATLGIIPLLELAGDASERKLTKVLNPPTLAPGDSGSVMWLLTHEAIFSDGRYPLVVHITSTDADETVCEEYLELPAFEKPLLIAHCSISDTLSYDETSEKYSPQPLTISVSIENRRYIPAFNVQGRITLPDGVEFDPGGQADKKVFIPSPIIRGNPSDPMPTLDWTVRYSGRPCADTSLPFMIKIYGEMLNGMPTDTAVTVCVLKIPGKPETFTCEVIAPDSMRVAIDGSGLQELPLRVQAVVSNRTPVRTELRSIALSGLAQGMTLHPQSPYPLTAALHAMLDPATTDTITWLLNVENSRNPRIAELRITSSDADGCTRTCGKNIAIPAVQGLLCATDAPDTARFILSQPGYEPNPLPFTLMLTNVLDRDESEIEVELVLNNVTRLELASGESAKKTLQAIASKTKHSFTWLLTPLSGQTDEWQTLRARYRSREQGTWFECSATILVERWGYELGIRCAASGHDSVFTDAYYEKMLPEPISVSYEVSNTGTVTLHNCEARIVLPAEFELAAGMDAQHFGDIAPAATVTRWWTLRITSALSTFEDFPIGWIWSSDEQGSGTGCDHRLHVVPYASKSIVVTPLHVHFEAYRDGPLPAEQHIELWTGSGLDMPWTATRDDGWLGVAPEAGSRSVRIAVQPEVTSLAIGRHLTSMTISSQVLSAPTKVSVTYDILDVLSAPRQAAASTLGIDAVWPQPIERHQPLFVRIDARVGANVRISVHDALGRERARLLEGMMRPEHMVLRFNPSEYLLEPGLYILRLTGEQGLASKVIIVR